VEPALDVAPSGGLRTPLAIWIDTALLCELAVLANAFDFGFQAAHVRTPFGV
jgi:hypothetical protein